MKADEDVRMISVEAPFIFARACEMFILELTLRSWNHIEENKRRTLQKNDIAAAITQTDIFDFLVVFVPYLTLHSFNDTWTLETHPSTRPRTIGICYRWHCLKAADSRYRPNTVYYRYPLPILQNQPRSTRPKYLRTRVNLIGPSHESHIESEY
ncbi:hypothetical protein CerSpe_015920 [Prunus speciosa]